MKPDENNIPDITDQIQISEQPDDNDIFLDLQGEQDTLLQKQNTAQTTSHNTVLFDFAKEVSSSESAADLYEILIFTLIGQLGSSSATVIQPSPTVTGRWFLAEHHGSRLRNRSITFKDNQIILSTLIHEDKILDLKLYEDNMDYVEEYQKFFSIGARVAVPVRHNDITVFVILLGEKIEAEDYTEDDYKFLKSATTISAIIYSKIIQIDSLKEELTSLKVLEERLDRIDQYEFHVRSSKTEDIRSTIQTEMESLQVNSYAYFLFNDTTNNFEVQYCDKNDSLHLLRDRLAISNNNALIAYCQKQNDYSEIDNPVSSEILKHVFQQDFLIKVNVFGIFPYSVQGHLAGILLILRINTENFSENVPQIKRFSRFVFSQLYTRKHHIFGNSHIDSLQGLFSRIINEEAGCRLMGIPLTIAVITISGYGKSVDALSLQKVSEIQRIIKSIFEKNKSETDFSFRNSFNEFTVVFPGKQNKHAQKAAASIKHGVEKLSRGFSVTYIVITYPDDKKPYSYLFEKNT